MLSYILIVPLIFVDLYLTIIQPIDYFLFSSIKMSLDPSLPKIPPRLRKPIECVSYHRNIERGGKKIEDSNVLCSFRGNEKDGLVKEYLTKLDEQQEAQAKSREAYTERKIKIISGSPYQKTQKKKFIKLFSTINARQCEGKSEKSHEDFESMIADEQYDGAGHGKTEQVRASLNYFTNELGLMNKQIRQSGVHLEIENEVRIVMLSQQNSDSKLSADPPQATRRRDYEMSPTQKIRRKIMISCNQQKKQTCSQNTSCDVYRYCIGCQFPIIQANITRHEQECHLFQQVYQMSYQEIADFLKGMIGELSRKIQHIQQSLTVDDLKNLKVCTDGLLQQSELISLSGQSNQSYDIKYQSIQKVSLKWVWFAEQICKLNWFIKLRQSVRRSQGK